MCDVDSAVHVQVDVDLFMFMESMLTMQIMSLITVNVNPCLALLFSLGNDSQRSLHGFHVAVGFYIL